MDAAAITYVEIYSSLEAGKPETALNYLDEKAPDKENLPFLFERGLVAHYADRYKESNVALSRAESISEDLYTRQYLQRGSRAHHQRLW